LMRRTACAPCGPPCGRETPPGDSKQHKAMQPRGMHIQHQERAVTDHAAQLEYRCEEGLWGVGVGRHLHFEWQQPQRRAGQLTWP
jgi:hypothetical protein